MEKSSKIIPGAPPATKQNGVIWTLRPILTLPEITQKSSILELSPISICSQLYILALLLIFTFFPNDLNPTSINFFLLNMPLLK